MMAREVCKHTSMRAVGRDKPRHDSSTLLLCEVDTVYARRNSLSCCQVI